ncbi:unnamed protein product [Phytomonas sp. EM1]|nr:unnamed protein product [Phytomonas sp. EM1]|eukprot:CCW60079.1 unnamed protein product [Phytomonas sp. isolate EM1]
MEEIDAGDVPPQPTTTRAGKRSACCVALHEHDTNPVQTEEIVQMAHDAIDVVGLAAVIPKQVLAQNTSPNTSLAWEAVGEVKSFSDKEIATELKRKLDEKYGGVWHVIVGAHFGGNITSDAETLANFQIDKRHFLVFRSGPPERPILLDGSGVIAEI